MLARLKRAELIWPTVFAVAGLAILVGLGTWQLERKQWKEGLIAKIAARVDAPPIWLARNNRITALDVEDPEYLHVGFQGRFHYDKERYLYAPAPSGLGWHVYTPLELAPSQFVWINRGFVPDVRKDPASRPEGQVLGVTEVTGLLRQSRTRAYFTPDNDVSHNLWYWPDVVALQRSAFSGTGAQALAFAVDADATSAPPGGLPAGGVTRLDLPNRHLEYAVTWYGLSLTLIGVYAAFAAGRLRAAR